MNKKGQALVEFVIILPIFIFMLLAMIDIGKIIYLKNNLENRMSSVIDLYKNKNTLENIERKLSLEDENITLETKIEKNETITFTLKKEVSIITPGLSIVFGTPYTVEINRVMPYE